jgi:hypothetical protein
MIILTLLGDTQFRVHIAQDFDTFNLRETWYTIVECEKCGVSVVVSEAIVRLKAVETAFKTWQIMNSSAYPHTDCSQHRSPDVPFDPPYTIHPYIKN